MPHRHELVDPLLQPIPGDNPSGRSVRDDDVYLKLVVARTEEDDVDQGAWQRERRVAKPAEVLALASRVLTETSKDILVAVWWAEAMLRRDGLPGLRDGMALVNGLVARYWDTLYPPIIDGDDNARAGDLGRLTACLRSPLLSAPMNKAGHGFLQYQAALLAGSDDETRSDAARRAKREELANRGGPVIEDVLAQVDVTPTAWYRELVASLDETIVALAALDTALESRFQDDPPSFRAVMQLLESHKRDAATLLARRLQQEPDGGPALPAAAAPVETAGGTPAAAVVAGTASLLPSGETDAVQRVVVAARFLRRQNSADPTPYALLRGLRWSELRAVRADGAPVPASMLHAPPTAERSRLKTLFLEQQYETLLDGVEELTGAVRGAAWLDAQRWAIEAATHLGADYAPVRQLLVTELQALLRDCPALPHMTLLDDSPVANAETLTWLDAMGMRHGAGQEGASPTLESMPSPARRPMLERARSEAAAGRLDRGVAMLMSDIARERSERARFLRQIELVTVLLDASRAAVAMPTIDTMLEQIDAHKLEGWEDGATVAQALVLACRAIDATDGDSRRRADLFLRVCRLDPIAALSIGG